MSSPRVFLLASVSRRLLLDATRIRDDRRGVTAIEFAMIAPILIALMISIVDLGVGMYTDTQLANAAQAGATYAMQKGYDAGVITTVTQASTRLTGVSVAVSQYCGCPSNTGVVTATCGSSCSGGLTAGTFAQVVATKDYSPLLSYPALPGTFHLSETAMARTQ